MSTGANGSDRAAPLLFTPLRIREVEAANRVMVSPMCMGNAHDGVANDYHLVHLGRFALGGAGIIVAEATAVHPVGRISHRDLGLWKDEQGAALAPVAKFISDRGSVPGIQLAHAGRKGSNQPGYEGGGPLAAGTAGDASWQTVAPSATSPGPGWQVPTEMTREQIADSVQDWARAARRAVDAGFRLIDLHGAHGYLLHSFVSPISNARTDEYGGSFANRMRYPLAVVRAVREAMGDSAALLYRLSAVDGLEDGLKIADTVEFALALREAGVDMVDTSSGGIVTDRSIDTRVRRGYAFHAPYSGPLRRATGMPVASVGMIVDPEQAEAVLQNGDADVVALGREMLDDPNWTHHARLALDHEDWTHWHREAAGHLRGRAQLMSGLTDKGETPMTRYSG